MADRIPILSKYRGTLLGVLVGDCLGAPFECRAVEPMSVYDQIDNILKSDYKLQFTDDTAMTMSTIKSLVEHGGINPKELAKEYTESYFKEPGRGYGLAVVQVFKQLRDTKYENPFMPASKQFNGSGSFGNGAAMRCSGLALFSIKNNLNDEATLRLVESCSKITHSHPHGINGAILLVMALRYVLVLEDESLDEAQFLHSLTDFMYNLELPDNRVFTQKLKAIIGVIERLSIDGTDVTQADIVGLLGNDVTAQNSVPLAIYSFLRGISKFTDSYQLENEFMRTLHWAISCGGDTDTIASMACGLTGAYLGDCKLSEDLYKKCEGWREMFNLAAKLASSNSNG